MGPFSLQYHHSQNLTLKVLFCKFKDTTFAYCCIIRGSVFALLTSVKADGTARPYAVFSLPLNRRDKRHFFLFSFFASAFFLFFFSKSFLQIVLTFASCRLDSVSNTIFYYVIRHSTLPGTVNINSCISRIGNRIS